MSAPTFSFADKLAPIVREAGELLIGYFDRRVRIEYKAEADLVTEADRACEKLLITRIRAQWPEHNIVAEEGSAHHSPSDYKWYVDPLDGTTNFAHGFPVFCISMGLERKGELIAGVIYDPSRKELFAAEKGAGAYLNGTRIQVSRGESVAEALLATGFPSQKRHKNPNIYFYHALSLRSHGVRRAGSAALDLASVASGRFDGFWEFNLNPWDTAAGVLMVREAGGQVGDFSGGPFKIASREVLASNGKIHAELLELFRQIRNGDLLEELPQVGEKAR